MMPRRRRMMLVGLIVLGVGAAVAFARELDGVDPERIVLWGTSWSGGHVVYVGADDPRIAAVISRSFCAR